MGNETKEFDLQERLIEFSVRIIRLSEALPNTMTGRHVRGQILRSGTSAGPNYAEAQAAESRSDFVHKLKVVLKELRETTVWLLIICRAKLVQPASLLEPILRECNELTAIFVKSIKTASR